MSDSGLTGPVAPESQPDGELPGQVAAVGERRPPSRVLFPVLLMIGLVTAVTSSLGAPLLVTIARVDRVSVGEAQWSLTITLLVGAVAAPVLGRLGDGPARRGATLGCLVIVTLGSVLAALPMGGFPLLLVGRAMHGFGLGLLPLTMTIARDNLPPGKAGPAIAVLSLATFVGVGLGFPVTGILDEWFGLHAPFWFGAITGGLVLMICVVVLPASSHLRRNPLDIAGAVLLGLALTALLVAVTQGQPWGWGSPRVLALLVAALVLGAAWVWRERTTTHPLVDLSLLRHRSLAITNVMAVLLAVAMYIALPLLTEFAQTPRSAGYGSGATVVVTGLMLLPFSILTAFMSRVSRVVGARIGRERAVAVGALIVVAPFAMFTIGTVALWEGFVAFGLVGIGAGFSFAVMPGMILSSVPPQETGSALGFYQVVRYVGFSLGSDVSASILAAYTRHGQAYPARMGYTVSFITAIGVCLVVAGAGAFLGRPRPVVAAAAGSAPSSGFPPTPIPAQPS